MTVQEAVETLDQATTKWHPCDKKTEALTFLVSEIARLNGSLDEAKNHITVLLNRLHEILELSDQLNDKLFLSEITRLQYQIELKHGGNVQKAGEPFGRSSS